MAIQKPGITWSRSTIPAAGVPISQTCPTTQSTFTSSACNISQPTRLAMASAPMAIFRFDAGISAAAIRISFNCGVLTQLRSQARVSSGSVSGGENNMLVGTASSGFSSRFSILSNRRRSSGKCKDNVIKCSAEAPPRPG